MKNEFGRLALLTFALALQCGFVNAQGTFTNLGFESSVPSAMGGGHPPDLMGWNANYPSFHNTISLGGAAVILHDSSSPYLSPLIGNYSLLLFNGLQPPAGDRGIAEVWQTGTLPGNAQSVRFVATSLTPVVSFAGNLITAQRIGGNARFNVFAGDISTYAGQTGELRFSHTGMLDGISFSVLPVPEPGAVVLLSVGAILLWTRLRQRR